MELFSFIARVIMPPQSLSNKQQYQQWEFVLDEEDMRSIARDAPGPTLWRAVRHVVHGTRTFRLRCLKLHDSQKLPSQEEWVVADHVWPGSLTVLMNDTAQELRRKSHHGKDLPIDVTSYIQKDRNSLTVAILGLPDNSPESVVVAIEIIQMTDLNHIKANIPTLDVETAKHRIKEQTENRDANIEVLNPQIAIDLTDPFTARIYSVPVRGKQCRHSQCFDLDTFLQTRFGKNTNKPCNPDSFRCPICGGDVRPPKLVKDGFLMAVRQELEMKGRLDVKAIILHESGAWDIKEGEGLTGESGDGTGRRVSSRTQNVNTVRTMKGSSVTAMNTVPGNGNPGDSHAREVVEIN